MERSSKYGVRSAFMHYPVSISSNPVKLGTVLNVETATKYLESTLKFSHQSPEKYFK